MGKEGAGDSHTLGPACPKAKGKPTVEQIDVLKK